MKNRRGRPTGTFDSLWPERMATLLSAIASIQARRHTVSMRELGEVCGVSRQSISNWLKVAEQMGFVDLHDGQPRALQLLPVGRKYARKASAMESPVGEGISTEPAKGAE